MMQIIKTENKYPLPRAEEFTMQEGVVQGAKIGKKDNCTLVQSPKRYKLFAEGVHVVVFLQGRGFFKWKRGETPFAAPDAFEVREVGEYEVNGDATFVVVRVS